MTGRGGGHSGEAGSQVGRSGGAVGTAAPADSGSGRKLSPAILLVIVALGLVVAWAVGVRGDGGAAPPAVPQRGLSAPGEAGGEAFGTADPCAAFDTQVWAQTVFAAALADQRDLDPDGDGVACEALPLGAAPALWTDSVPTDVEQVSLLEAIDGDTIEVRRADGAVERVRLVGIDTPETGFGAQPPECYGPEASRFTDALLADAGGVVYLEKDVEERDRYGRLLRWVWFEADGRPYLANEAIARAGYGERFRDTPNRRYVDEIVAAQAFAQEFGYGMWAACG